MIVINEQEEIEKYYNKETNTYIFNDDVKFNCGIDVESDIISNNIEANDILYVCNIHSHNITANNIKAFDIHANDIDADDIHALDIHALDINAIDIHADDIVANSIKANDIIANDIVANSIFAYNTSYFKFCIARNSFKCKKIYGRHENAIHKCLDNDIEFVNDDDEEEKMFAINKQDINYLIEKELSNALKFGKFNSDHEFYAVLKEEIEEVNYEIWKTNLNLDDIWKKIKNDDKIELDDIEKHCENALKEISQVIAVIRKYRSSFDE